MTEPDEGRRVVLVVADGTDRRAAMADRLRSDGDLAVRTESDPAAARTVVATTPVACVVVDFDSVAGTDEFLADVGTIAPDCPIVAVTDGDHRAVLDRVTTVVDRAADGDWSFLAQKVRSALGASAGRGEDVETYRSLVESARDGLYRLDENGDVVYTNESFAEMLGFDRGEILGSHAAGAMAPGELERGQELIRDVLEDDDTVSDIIDMEMETADGERIVVSVHFVVVTDEDGRYDGVIGVARDVTDRRDRQAELRRKNERLEAFASMVSHDLRSPLTVAKGRLELAQAEREDENVTEALQSLERMGEMIDELLTLAREGETAERQEPCSMDEMVRGCWDAIADGGATLDSRTGLTVLADPTRLKQLLENLLGNAIDHAGEGVHVVVGDLPDGDGFYVADDGPGVPAADRESVFDTGYSTREDGTGFGLAIVRDAASAHGWTVEVGESEAGGARFEVRRVETVKA